MAVGGYTTAILMVDHGVKDIWTIPIAALVAGIVGFLFGFPALRLSGLYLALATFAIAVATPAVIKRFEGFTGGGSGINLFGLAGADGVADAGRRSSGRSSTSTTGSTTCRGRVALVLVRRSRGCSCAAGPGGRSAPCATARPRRCRSGVSLARYKTLAFGVSAAYAGVAGSLFAIATTFVNPDTFPIALSIFLLVGVVVGGLGSLVGLDRRRGLHPVHAALGAGRACRTAAGFGSGTTPGRRSSSGSS